jgi:hypothetical protein
MRWRRGDVSHHATGAHGGTIPTPLYWRRLSPFAPTTARTVNALAAAAAAASCSTDDERADAVDDEPA